MACVIVSISGCVCQCCAISPYSEFCQRICSKPVIIGKDSKMPPNAISKHLVVKIFVEACPRPPNITMLHMVILLSTMTQSYTIIITPLLQTTFLRPCIAIIISISCSRLQKYTLHNQNLANLSKNIK